MNFFVIDFRDCFFPYKNYFLMQLFIRHYLSSSSHPRVFHPPKEVGFSHIHAHTHIHIHTHTHARSRDGSFLFNVSTVNKIAAVDRDHPNVLFFVDKDYQVSLGNRTFSISSYFCLFAFRCARRYRF